MKVFPGVTGVLRLRGANLAVLVGLGPTCVGEGLRTAALTVSLLCA